MQLSASRQPFPLLAGLFLFALVPCGEALAHASERGHVLLLPTQYYALGGALAVAASFLILAFLPPQPLAARGARRLELFTVGIDGRAAVSLLSFLFLLVR
jgi:hypothetical protein